MNRTSYNYQNISFTSRLALAAIGIAMLATFYTVAMSGALLGAVVYLGLFSAIPIFVAMIGWSPIVLPKFETVIPKETHHAA